MSHDVIAVRFPDGLIRYGLYYGTVDVCYPSLWSSMVEAWAHTESPGPWSVTCPHADEAVVIHRHHGSWWEARACRLCSALTDGRDPWGEGVIREEGPPAWSPLVEIEASPMKGVR